MNVKILSLASLLAAVGSAQAVAFNFRSTGTATGPLPTFSVSDTSLTGYIGTAPTPAYSFVSLAFTPTYAFVGAATDGTVSGTGTLTVFQQSTASNQALTFSFAGAASRTGTNDNISFANLSFVLTGLNLVGTGSFSSNLTATTPGSPNMFSQTTFVSNLNPVPEPASLAALGLGAAGLIRRRRRA